MSQDQTPSVILAAVEFDDSGAVALRQALQLARRAGNVELHLVHVLDPTGEDLRQLGEALENTMDLLRAHAAMVAEDINCADDLPVVPIGHVRIGVPAGAIHQVAVDINADLIIVGTHARRGLNKVVLGSVSEDLVKLAHAPVLVARTKDYSALRQTDGVEPARPGQDMAAPSITRNLILAHAERISHLPGLI